MRNRKWYCIISLCFVIGCMALIFRLSSQVATESNMLSTNVTERIVKTIVPQYDMKSAAKQKALVKTFNHYVRKGAHFSIYTLLGIFLFMLFFCKKGCSKRAKWCSIIIGLLYAISDEFHQRFVPGRGAQIQDVCIDLSGVIVGVLIGSLIVHFMVTKYQK